jgi:F-type H+-transporting ATPase subunit b
MTAHDHAMFEAIALWSQVVCAVVFLLVIIWVFRKYLLPGVIAAESARNAELAEAEKRREASKAEIAKARAELEVADRDAASIVQRATADAQREAERIVADAQAEAERTVRNAEGELQRARIAAQSALRTEYLARALERARREADLRIDAETNTRLVHATVDALAGAEKSAV